MASWRKIRLGDICEIERGGSPRPIKNYITNRDDGINWIKIGDTSSDSMYITSTKEKIIQEGVSKSRFVKSGDFLLTNSMSFGRPYILKVDGCIHDGWLVIRDEKNFFNKQFLYYLLSSDYMYLILKNMAVGGVVNNLNSQMVRNLELNVPTIDIQDKIAVVLEKAQELIDKRKEQISALDELVKSKFIEMFGDPVKNQKKLPKVELGSIGEWKAGGTPSRSNNEYYNGNISWLSSGELNNMYCFNSVEMITELAIKESSAKIIEKGSLLLGMYDTAALKSTINMIECSCNQAIAYSKLDEELVNTIYVYYCIQIGKDFYKSQQRGVRQKNLNLSMIKGLEILMPDLKSQNQFADFVNQIDKLKFEMQKSLEEMENNFNSLMQRAFKGELFI